MSLSSPLCPACKTMAHQQLVKTVNKVSATYYDCPLCGTLFVPGGLDQSGMVGGTGELVRQAQNEGRFKRMYRLLKMKDDARILDFGAGTGAMARYFTEHGLQTDAYDPYEPKMSHLDPEVEYDGVTMIEVAEHLGDPEAVFKEIHGLLKPGGVVMIESSFRITQFNEASVQNWGYCNPEIGHCTLYSLIGLDALMERCGFDPLEHLNDNVRVFVKMVQ